MVMDNPTLRETDYRIIENDTERVLKRRLQHDAVIDIDSNLIRLVMYDNSGRAPFPGFNEKPLIALGTGLDSCGNFTTDATESVRHVLVRFAAVAKVMGESCVDVLETEANGNAGNRAELVQVILAWLEVSTGSTSFYAAALLYKADKS